MIPNWLKSWKRLKEASLGDSQFTFDENGSSLVITCIVNGKSSQYTVNENNVSLNVR